MESGLGARAVRRASTENKLATEHVRKARDDFVLHVEEVAQRLVKTLCPKMIAALGVDELDIDAHPIAAALNAPFQHVSNV